ncbi:MULTISPECIES: hypothetical protein [Corallococcus]|uniref:hypothetical protein n=1 Tax=Corallococcus TaxID=83461 RepID=UPI0014940DBB|nr:MULTISPECIES: hypothetical protein [Corallococcus]MBN8471659.1 hypothetical protein [Corallococcus exiguus]NPC72270.1 hypothetical protein [Corallococcus exiguus]NPD23953.1 hypothetical protein [Corallococcus exiguus]NRD44566.1 hypothetical protein [Corallococcus exiguus]
MTSLTSLMLLAQVGSGRVQGGWGYVWACYGISVAAFVLYSVSLWARRPRAAADSKE